MGVILWGADGSKTWGKLQEFETAKRERGWAAKTVLSRNEGKTVGRKKPKRGSTRGKR
jgi:hypothetical protein